MSCLIQNPENTAAIAVYIAQLLNMRYEYNGMSAPETLGIVLSNCRVRGYYSEKLIYNELVKLNHAAYLGRYKKDEAYRIPKYKENIISHRAEYDHGEKDEYGYYNCGHYVIENWHYQMYKMIQFYNYQCCEDETINNILYKSMQDLEVKLAKFIVENTELYKLAKWM